MFDTFKCFFTNSSVSVLPQISEIYIISFWISWSRISRSLNSLNISRDLFWITEEYFAITILSSIDLDEHIPWRDVFYIISYIESPAVKKSGCYKICCSINSGCCKASSTRILQWILVVAFCFYKTRMVMMHWKIWKYASCFNPGWRASYAFSAEKLSNLLVSRMTMSPYCKEYISTLPTLMCIFGCKRLVIHSLRI